MAAGAGWSALGSAILGGQNAFNSAQNNILVRQQHESQLKSEGLQQQLLQQQLKDMPQQTANRQALLALQLKQEQDKVNELPDQHKMEKMSDILKLQGPDEAYNNPQFAELGRGLGVLPANPLPNLARAIEGTGKFGNGELTNAAPGMIPQAPPTGDSPWDNETQNLLNSRPRFNPETQTYEPTAASSVNRPLLNDVEQGGGGANMLGSTGAVPDASKFAGMAPRTGLQLPVHPLQFEKLKNDWGGENIVGWDAKNGTIHNLGNGQPQASGQGIAGAPTGDTALAGMDPKMATLVKGVADYSMQISPRATYYPSVMAAAKMYNPDFDEKEYPTRVGVKRSFASGADAQTIASANKVVAHLNTLREKGAALNNTSIPLANSAANMFLGATGDGRIDAYNVAADGLANELAKVFKGTGTSGQQEIAAFRASMNAAKSPDQQRQVIATGMELLKGQLDAIQTKWHNTMGQGAEDYPVLRPESQKLMETLGGIDVQPTPGSKVKGAQAPAAPVTPTAPTAGAGGAGQIQPGHAVSMAEVTRRAGLAHVDPQAFAAQLRAEGVIVQ